MASPATELVEYLVRAIVEEPDAVEVEEFDEGEELILEIKVADGDLGRVIGKRGSRRQVDPHHRPRRRRPRRAPHLGRHRRGLVRR